LREKHLGGMKSREKEEEGMIPNKLNSNYKKEKQIWKIKKLKRVKLQDIFNFIVYL